MKVAAIKHDLSEKVDQYFNTINEAASISDIVLGPEYALIDLSEDVIREKLSKISNRYKDTYIIPGTFLMNYSKDEVAMSAPIFYEGKFIDYILKKSDINDSQIALDRTGKRLHTANRSEMDKIFKKDSTSFRIYICADQGRYPLESTDLELITSYDLANGFHFHPSSVLEKRNIIGSDSQTRRTFGVNYNPSKSNVYSEIPHKELKNYTIFSKFR